MILLQRSAIYFASVMPITVNYRRETILGWRIVGQENDDDVYE